MTTPRRAQSLDRSRIRFRPVAERKSKFRIDDIAIDPDRPPASPPSAEITAKIESLAGEIRTARERGAPVAICHGAHLIKNGLAPLLVRMVEEGWLTHVATNGAGSIHDWEFAYLGRSTEDVRENVTVGEFGIWEETGAYISLALHVGSFDGLGYGASVGRMIAEERLSIPDPEELRQVVRSSLHDGSPPGDAVAREQASAALDLLAVLQEGKVQPGVVEIAHPWKHRSIQASCYERGVPFTVHPGIGQDIIYTHPLYRGGPVGRASMTDFTIYAQTILDLEGGVYLSVGSAIMSPMVFEKSLSMARNIRQAEGKDVTDFALTVNDLAVIDWDWSLGEPPVDDPAYYVRFMKSFSRMGGRLQYVGMDNRDFLLGLYHELRK